MKKLIPLSTTQKLIWLDAKISGDLARFNIGGYAQLKGPVDFPLLDFLHKPIAEKK